MDDHPEVHALPHTRSAHPSCARPLFDGDAGFDTTDETVMRFNCKMALLWSPSSGRFAFADNATRYFTSCTFEDHMWHHAYVSIDDQGFGQLYVDGTAMSLEVPVNASASNYSAGFQPAPLGNKFHTHMFPAHCPMGPDAHRARLEATGWGATGRKRSRALLGEDTTDDESITGGDVRVGGVMGGTSAAASSMSRRGGGFELVRDEIRRRRLTAWGEGPGAGTHGRKLQTLPSDADVSLFTGFDDRANFTSDYNNRGTINGIVAYVACCRFHIGYKCDGTEPEFEGPIVSANFVGLVDETAVWNRPLTDDEVEFALFKMPRGMPAREMRANHGVQLDITLGQVHYGKFNNPCKEGPTTTVSGSPAHDTDVADFAAFTAGFINDLGRPRLVDDSNDRIQFNIHGAWRYPWFVRYAYTGVPWATPLVTGMVNGTSVAIDGGTTIRLTGVGFAPSPFLKCALAQTDPNGGHNAAVHHTYPAAPDPGKYHNYYRGATSGFLQVTTAPFMFDREPRATLGPGKVVFGAAALSGVGVDTSGKPLSEGNDWTGLTDPRHRSQSAKLAASWTPGTYTRDGKVPPFWQEPNDPRALGRDVGFFEMMDCVAPAAPAVMAGYYLGASNDGGLSGSPSQLDLVGTPAPKATYREFAGAFTGVGSSVSFPSALLREMGNAFTISAWIRPSGGGTAAGYVLNVGDGVGFTVDNGGRLRATVSSTGPTYGTGNGIDVSKGEWHHVALVVSGTAATGWIDGGLDPAASSAGMTIAAFSASNGPASVVFGGGFSGHVDEVKVWTSALAGVDWLPSAMWDRVDVVNPNATTASKNPPPAPAAYYRFNDVAAVASGSAKDSMATSAAAACSGLVSKAVAAPWEPTTMDTVEGIAGPAAAVVEVVRSVMRGEGKTLNVTGFNFAPSPFLKCVWGDETVLAARAHPRPALAAPGNFDKSGGATCADYGRSGGLAAESAGVAMLVAGARRVAAIDANHSTVAVTPGAHTDGTSVMCPLPADATLGYSRLAVLADRTFTTLPYEFTEEALECGSARVRSAANADVGVALPAAVPAALAASATAGGYTLAFWALPSAPTPGVILRVSGAAEDDELVVEFDGERFAVRDRFVGRVTARGPAVTIGEWAYVVLSHNVTAGRAALMTSTEANASEAFNTLYTPAAATATHACPVEPSVGGGGAFQGWLDEVRIWPSAVDGTAAEGMMRRAVPAGLVAHAAFDAAELAAAAVASNASSARPAHTTASTAPWHPSVVYAVKPETLNVQAAATVEVLATNLAPSQWLQVDTGAGAAAPSDVGVYGVMAPSTDLFCGASVNPTVHTGAAVEAASSVREDAAYRVEGSAGGLELGLHARYTFEDDAPGADGTYAAFDYSARVKAANETGATYASASRVQGRDPHSFAAAFSAAASLHVPAPPIDPAGTSVSVCVWIRLTGANMMGALAEELAYAWQQLCTVTVEGATAAYVNDAAASPRLAPVIAELLTPVSTANGAGVVLGGARFAPTASGGSGLLAGVEGALDEAWVWARAVEPCEIALLYRAGQAFALAFGSALDVALPASAPKVVATLAVPENFETTVGMWIKMTETKVGETQWVLSSEHLSIGITGNNYVVTMNLGECACAPCNGYRTLASEQMRIPVGTWVNIAVDWSWYGFFNGHIVMVYIDGVLVEYEIYEQAGRIPAFPAKDVDFTLGDGFNGLISDVHVNPSGQVPPNGVKEAVQCPFHFPNSLNQTTPASMLLGTVRLGEGAGNVAKAGAVTGTAGHWTAIGEDAAGTVGSKTTIEGTGLTQARSGETARFVITSRTGCGIKRRVGGDVYVVTINATGTTSAANDVFADVRDANDGNYFVSYTLPVGTYETVVTLQGHGEITRAPLVISYSPADPTKTTVVGGSANGGGPVLGCAGVVTRFQIAALDRFGAPALGYDAEFEVKLTGPGSPITARVTPGAGARYDVAFTPDAPGRYLVDMRMKSPLTGGAFVPFGDGAAGPTRYHCAEVCYGHALKFPGAATSYLSFEEAAGGGGAAGEALKLAGDAGLTMEAWLKLDDYPSTGSAILLKKGTPASQKKTYSLEVTSGAVVRATVYIGLGETRAVETTQVTNDGQTWRHYAAVYASDGSSFVMYVDGVVAANQTWPALPPRPALANINGEPLTLGAFLTGSLDEVKLWPVARTAEQVAADIHCLPYADIADLAFYLSANHPPGYADAIVAHSKHCPPNSAAALNGECLRAVRVEGDSRRPIVFTDAGSQPLTAGVAIGVVSGARSGVAAAAPMNGDPSALVHVAGSVAPRYVIAARDTCGMRYQGSASEQTFVATGHPTEMRVSDPNRTPIPLVDIHPREFVGAGAPQPSPTPLRVSPGDNRTRCSAGAATADPSLPFGDEFVGVLDLTAAGTFEVRVKAAVGDGAAVMGSPMKATVQAAATARVDAEEAWVKTPMHAGVPGTLVLKQVDRHGNSAPMSASGAPGLECVVALHAVDVAAAAGAVSSPPPPRVFSTGSSPPTIAYDAAAGLYTFHPMLATPGNYSVTCDLLGGGPTAGVSLQKPDVFYVEVAPAPWREMNVARASTAAAEGATGSDGPTGYGPMWRTSHAAAEHEGDVYVFGGVGADKGYLGDTWRLDDAAASMAAGTPALAYRKSVAVSLKTPPAGEGNDEDADGPGAVASVVEVVVNTEELIAAGRMGRGCLDVAFTAPSSPEDPLAFHLDPRPGCDAADSRYFVRLPKGVLASGGHSTGVSEVHVSMYYGNPTRTRQSPHANPAAVFDMYETFEEGLGRFAPAAPCASTSSKTSSSSLGTPQETVDGSVDGFKPTPAHAGPAADGNTMVTVGAGSLHAPSGSPAALVAPWPPPGVGSNASNPMACYVLRAKFYDGGALESAHSIAAAAEPVCAGDASASYHAVGVGTYSPASQSRYCATAPWTCGGGLAAGSGSVLGVANRSAGWHQLEVTSDFTAGYRVSVDGVVIARGPSKGPLPGIVIAAGLGGDPGIAPAAAASWGEVTVGALDPYVVAVVAAPMSMDEAVSQVPGRTWTLVEPPPGTSTPSPRAGHAGVTHGGTLYVIGGERASVAFNDVWALDMEGARRAGKGENGASAKAVLGAWSYVVPASFEAPPPRYDHAAVVIGDRVVVHGGRGGGDERTVLSDAWSFDLRTLEWRRLTAASATGARFGHSMAYVAATGKAYAFGGYVVAYVGAESAPGTPAATSGGAHGTGGFSRTLWECDPADASFRCFDLTLGCPSKTYPGGVFLPNGLTARYGHRAVATASSMFIIGGVGDQDDPTGPGGGEDVAPGMAFRFDAEACAMTQLGGAAMAGFPNVNGTRAHHAAGVTAAGEIFVQGGLVDGAPDATALRLSL